MLTFPNLPTDSLYKFVFISGIVLIVVSLYQKTKTYDEYFNQIIKLDSTFVVHSDTLIKVKSQMQFLEPLTRLTDSAYLKTYFIYNSVRIKDRNTAISRFNQLGRERVRLELAGVFLNHKREKVEYAYGFQKYLCYAMEIWAIVMMVGGGFCWFKYIQEPQDRLLKIQLQVAEKELEQKTKVGGRKHFEPQMLHRPEVRNR